MSLLAVSDQGGVLVLDSRLIAAELDVDHTSFMKTLETYKTVIEQAFGIIRFEIEKTGTKGRPLKYGLLTEDQAILATTFSRNTEQVVKCKVRVVEAFSKAKQIIPAQQAVIHEQKRELLSMELEIERLRSERVARNEIINASGGPGMVALLNGLPGAYVEKEVVVPKTVVIDGAGRTIFESNSVGITELARRYGFGNNTKACWAWLESIGHGKGSEAWNKELTAIPTERFDRDRIAELDQKFAQGKGSRQKLIGEVR